MPALTSRFDESIVLFDNVDEVIKMSQLGQSLVGFEGANGFGVSRILIEINNWR